MRLIKRKSDWWVVLAIYGSATIGGWLLIRDPWLFVNLSNVFPFLALALGLIFVGAVVYGLVTFIWERRERRRRRIRNTRKAATP